MRDEMIEVMREVRGIVYNESLRPAREDIRSDRVGFLNRFDEIMVQFQQHEASTDMALSEVKSTMSALIFTATKLWDEVKPIKDTDSMTVTHPIIEEAKQALSDLISLSGGNN